jgi:hypothetical protein
MAMRTGRVFGAAVLVAVVGAGLTGCNGTKDAMGCGKTAISIAGDVQDLQDSATNVGQLTDKARRQRTVDALKKLGDDASQLSGSGGGKAAQDLTKAVENAQQSVAHGKKPDLGPIGTAAAEATKACASG